MIALRWHEHGCNAVVRPSSNRHKTLAATDRWLQLYRRESPAMLRSGMLFHWSATIVLPQFGNHVESGHHDVTGPVMVRCRFRSQQAIRSKE